MIFAVGAALCCVALGLNAGAAARRRLERLEDGVEAIERMKLAMEERQPLCRVLAAAGRGPVGSRLAAAGGAMERQPLLTPLDAWQGDGELSAEESCGWEKLMERLSSGTLESRLQALCQWEKQLNLQLETERQREARAQPLRRSLSGLGGLALLLLLG